MITSSNNISVEHVARPIGRRLFDRHVLIRTLASRAADMSRQINNAHTHALCKYVNLYYARTRTLVRIRLLCAAICYFQYSQLRKVNCAMAIRILWSKNSGNVLYSATHSPSGFL